MNPDLALVIGLVIGVLSIPSILSAVTERRTPRAASIVVLFSGALIVYALTQKPGGYPLEDIPGVFIGVINRFIG